MKEVKVVTIRVKGAKRTAEVFDKGGVLTWCQGRKKGHKVLYIYTEKRKKNGKQKENTL